MSLERQRYMQAVKKIGAMVITIIWLSSRTSQVRRRIVEEDEKLTIGKD
jgi:hypothetical protein